MNNALFDRREFFCKKPNFCELVKTGVFASHKIHWVVFFDIKKSQKNHTQISKERSVNMTQATLSFNMTNREICIEHNNREIPVPHSDSSLMADNFFWSENKSLQEIYAKMFSADVEEYNARQKRKDRRIENYLEKVIDGFEREKVKIDKLKKQSATRHTIRQNQKAVKPCYEFIISLGNKRDTPQFRCADGKQRLLAKEILQRYIEDFAKRYNGRGFGIEMFNSAIHLDETENNGIVHGHINIVFHSNDNKRGMRHQVSMNKALYQLGFCGDENKLAITKWEEYERGILTELCAQYGIEIIKGNGGEHKHKDQYILEQEQKTLEQQKEDFTNLLYETETGNTFLVMRENDDLREELATLQDKSDTEDTRLSQLWEDYKRDNTEYWQRYNEHKTQLKNEIALLVSQKKSDQERLRDMFNSVFADNGFILFKLFRLISALFLKFKIDRQEQEMKRLQEIHKQLKQNAKTVCNMSKTTAQALKGKEIENIYATLEMWENTLKTVNMSIENHLDYIAPERTDPER